jgi:hypothetical protein
VQTLHFEVGSRALGSRGNADCGPSDGVLESDSGRCNCAITSELPTIRELAGSVKECRDARHVLSIRSEERYCHNAVITLLA